MSVREGVHREVLVWCGVLVCVGTKGNICVESLQTQRMRAHTHTHTHTHTQTHTHTHTIADREDARLIHVCSDYVYTYM